MELMEHQKLVVDKLSSGKVLYGGVGDGKSIAALAYYMKHEAPRHIKVITTAKKRDTLDWEGEAAKFGIGTQEYATLAGIIEVDSWNNIRHYEDCEDMFFIFDEQRVIGHGAWVKSFLKIAKKNHWILLSGTPGDTWLDYAPLFIANGFYKNITDFKRKHVLYEPFMKYPVVRGYLNERKLEMLRNEVLVEMPFRKHTERMINWIDVAHSPELWHQVTKLRWNPYEERPIKDAAELGRLMRRIVNSDPDRLEWVKKLLRCHDRLVIFYNFNYELDILRTLDERGVSVYEYNGHKKDPVPPSDGKWVYLVQYMAGAEGWNCTSTDGMVLYSLTHSYKNFEQAQGRIDRLNTLYTSLFYYIFVSNTVIDRRIKKNLGNKEDFNERRFVREEFGLGPDWEGNSDILEPPEWLKT